MISRQKLKIRSNYPSALSYWALGNRPMTEANRPGYVCISNPSLPCAPHSTATVDARQGPWPRAATGRRSPAPPVAVEAPCCRCPAAWTAEGASRQLWPKEPCAAGRRRGPATLLADGAPRCRRPKEPCAAGRCNRRGPSMSGPCGAPTVEGLRRLPPPNRTRVASQPMLPAGGEQTSCQPLKVDVRHVPSLEPSPSLLCGSDKLCVGEVASSLMNW